jgi:hypothetical protein
MPVYMYVYIVDGISKTKINVLVYVCLYMFWRWKFKRLLHKLEVPILLKLTQGRPGKQTVQFCPKRCVCTEQEPNETHEKKDEQHTKLSLAHFRKIFLTTQSLRFHIDKPLVIRTSTRLGSCVQVGVGKRVARSHRRRKQTWQHLHHWPRRGGFMRRQAGILFDNSWRTRAIFSWEYHVLCFRWCCSNDLCTEFLNHLPSSEAPQWVIILI